MDQNSEAYFQYTPCRKIPAGRKRLRFIVDAIKTKSGDRSPGETEILDYGCGNGYVTTAIASLGYRIDGVDIDKSSIEFSQENNKFENASFHTITEESESLSQTLGQKKYDVVVSSEVLQWTRSPGLYLRSARHYLKDNGVLILTDENHCGPRAVLGRSEQALLNNRALKPAINFVRDKLGMTSTDARGQLYSANPEITKRQVKMHHSFSISSIRKLFSSEGFEIIEERNSFFLFSVFGLSGKAKLDDWDSKFADYLPRSVVSGWYFILRPKASVGMHPMSWTG